MPRASSWRSPTTIASRPRIGSAHLLVRLRANPHALVGGRTINALVTYKYSATSQILIDFLYERYTGSCGATLFFASNNFAMERSLFLSGGFTTLGGGRPKTVNSATVGTKLGYRPCSHRRPSSVTRTSSRYRRSGSSTSCMAAEPSSFETALLAAGERPMKIERPNFYRSLLFYPLHCKQTPRAFDCMVLMAISQIANVTGFGFEALFGRRRSATADGNGRSAHAFASGTMGDGAAAERAALRDASHIATSENAAAPTT